MDEFGAKLTTFDSEEWVQVKNPGGKFLKKVWTTKPVMESDVIVSLPKLKTHDIMLYTGAIKNFLGIVPGKHKSRYHQVSKTVGKMGDMLVDLFGYVKPKLAVMDGIVGMEENGPIDGPLRNIGIIAASTDSVALDAVCSSVVNYDPMEIPTTRIAAGRKLGVADMDKIEVLGEKIDDVKIRDFKRPTRGGW